MSSFGKTCTTCKKPIELSDKSGKWLPYNLNGEPHRCYMNGHESNDKKKPLSIEERVKNLEKFLGIGA